MGREQGDELGDEVVYVHPDYDTERPAYTPADVVNLEARGWVPKGSKIARTAGKGAPAKGASSGEAVPA